MPLTFYPLFEVWPSFLGNCWITGLSPPSLWQAESGMRMQARGWHNWPEGHL